MNSSLLRGALLVGLGAGATAWVMGRGIDRTSPPTTPPVTAPATPHLPAAREEKAVGAPDHRPSDGEGARIARLESLLAQQVALGSELAAKIDGLEIEIAALRERQQDAPPAPPASADAGATPRDQIDYSKSAMQRALEAAGLDEQTAESIKLRGDQLAMTEMYLRDQATREGWLDSPRFREEMAEIEAQRTSIREELGDDAYDRYLFALGRTNRVIVNDVMFDSVAEDVGLQTGDLIIRYGDDRVFATDELATQTREGTAGDPVTVVISRNGKRMELEVPRGPLGVRIGMTQDHPDAS